MNHEQEYLDHFQDNLNYFFTETVDMNLTRLSQCGFWIRTLNHQNHAGEVRRKRMERGLPAPPVMILSVTGRCNLECNGCYALLARKQDKGKEIPPERFETLIREAAGIGTNIILLTGGEPLLRMDILEAAARVKEIIFPVFTNGTLMDGDKIRFFRKHKNLVPVLSIEGNRRRTDERRGPGIHARVISVAEVLKRSKMFFGLSLTLTRDNFHELTNPRYLKHYHSLGCRLFFLVEYVPVRDADRSLCLTEEQKNTLPGLSKQLRDQLPALYVCMPGDEKQYGGCLAAGRGFIHISTAGDVEACPFASYSDSNILDTNLNDALNSPLMSRIRKSHLLLKESAGDCTLRENRDRVEKHLEKSGITVGLSPGP